MTKHPPAMPGDHLGLGETVARVAESLSPLGAVARIVAESTACTVAIKQLNVEPRQIDADTEVTLTELEYRRRDAAQSLRALRSQVGRTDLTAEQLRKCIGNMRRALGRPSTTVVEAKVYAELIRGFSADLLQHHSAQGDQVLTGIDLVLNGSDRDGVPGRRPGSDRYNSNARHNSSTRYNDGGQPGHRRRG